MVDVNEHDELVIVREATVDGQAFRVRAQLLDAERVRVDLVAEATRGRPSGGLAGEISVADLLPATSALTALFGGIAVAAGRARAGRLIDAGAVRRRYPKAYQNWSREDEERLLIRYYQGAEVSDLATEFGRQPGGIRARLAKLGLERLVADAPETEPSDEYEPDDYDDAGLDEEAGSAGDDGLDEASGR